MDIASLFAEAARSDPARPFITFYDDATGERTELSFVTFDNWVSKTANLLVDGAGLGQGDTAVVKLPIHWLAAVAMMGCWRAGVAIAHDGGEQVDVAFVSEDSIGETTGQPETYAIATAPMAVGLRGKAAKAAATNGEVSDFLVEVRGHGDHFFSAEPLTSQTPALVGLPGGAQRDHGQLVEAAAERAKELGISDGERIMLSAEVLRPMDWLLVPLAVKGSVVVCRNSQAADLDRRAASEHARIIEI